MDCDKCGKNMTNEDGKSLTGITIEVTDPEDIEEYNFCLEQMGKYSLNRKYAFCFECWLDSLYGS